MDKIKKRPFSDLFGLGLSLIITGIFFYQTILFGLLPVPTDVLVGRYHPWQDALSDEYPMGYPYKNPLITDSIRQQIVWRNLAIQAYLSGEWPGWDPTAFAGSPLDINIQSGSFYPFNIVFGWLPFEIAWTVLIMSQVLGLVWFTYGFLRSDGRSITAASLGSIMAGLSGFSISWLTWGTIISTYMWLPLLLLAVNHLTRASPIGKQVLWFFVLLFAAVNTMTAGHPQIALYVLSVCGSYWLFKAWGHRRSLWLMVLFVLLMGIIFGQFIFSLLQFLSTTVRTSASLWHQDGFFVPFRHLIQFVIPDYYGNPSTMNYFGSWNYGELTGYVGIVGLTFAMMGALVRRKEVVFWIAVIGFGLLLAVDNPLARLPYVFSVPFMSSLQPTRLISLVSFGMAILAAIGVDAYMRSLHGSKKVLLSFVVFIGIIICFSIVMSTVNILTDVNPLARISLRNSILPLGFVAAMISLILLPLRGRWLPAVLLTGLLMIDLFRFGWKFTPFSPAAFFFPETTMVTYLRNQPELFRVLSLDVETAPPNALGWYGIETFSGYNPLYTQRYARFFHLFQNGWVRHDALSTQRLFDITRFDSPLARLANVRYAVTIDPERIYFGEVVIQEGDTYLLERETLPRWYFADRVKTFTDDRQLLNALETDPLTDSPAFVEAELDAELLGVGQVDVISYTANQQVLAVENQSDGFLVNSTAWDARWHAYIDGVEVPILRTNYLFMGIVIHSGSHVIEFVYE